MALHIVFMELLIDPACSIAFEYEQEEKNIMKRKPRDPEEKFFGGKNTGQRIKRCFAARHGTHCVFPLLS